jgi:hypothetical protein
MQANPNLFMSIPQAGAHFFGLGRAGSYAAHRRGDFVTVTVGRNIWVSVPGMMERILNGWPPSRHHTEQDGENGDRTKSDGDHTQQVAA